MYCVCLLCVPCIYCFSPLFYCPVVSTTAVDAPVIDYVVDDRTPLPSSFQASRATSPLPHIAYLSIFICCTRHMLLLHYNPIQLHSLSLSPHDYFPISYAALYINLVFSSGPCALLVDTFS